MRFRQTLFWDTDPKKINSKKHARYIIERVLDLGNDEEIKWVWHKYSHKLIEDVVKKSRALHSKSKSFWFLYLL